MARSVWQETRVIFEASGRLKPRAAGSRSKM
jgi:hypothetical protein